VTSVRISMIAALARNRVIGRNGTLPWKLPDDTRHFVRTTKGKAVLMGRRTWEEVGAPLRGRDTIVLTRDPEFSAPGCTVVRGIEEGLRAAEGHEELVVCGGADVYAALLPRAERLYLTFVDAELEGDTFFPELDLSEWREVSRSDHPADARHAHAFSIVEYERLAGSRRRGAAG
jgi:dihydrofolate reductase